MFISNINLKSKPLALLIGLQYGGEIQLPNILVDLYIYFNYCEKLGMNVIIFTDILSDALDRNNLLDNHRVKPDILSFLSDKKDKVIFINNSKSLETHVRNRITNQDKIFLYFTGHAKRDKFIININDNMLMYDFKNLIYKETIKTCEILLCLDCCYSHTCTEVYNSENKIITKDYPKRKMIIIAQKENLSLLTNYGSFFTKSVISTLEKDISNLKTMKKNINDVMKNSNSCVIYKSLISLEAIYPWFIPCGVSIGDSVIYD